MINPAMFSINFRLSNIKERKCSICGKSKSTNFADDDLLNIKPSEDSESISICNSCLNKFILNEGSVIKNKLQQKTKQRFEEGEVTEIDQTALFYSAPKCESNPNDILGKDGELKLNPSDTPYKFEAVLPGKALINDIIFQFDDEEGVKVIRNTKDTGSVFSFHLVVNKTTIIRRISLDANFIPFQSEPFSMTKEIKLTKGLNGKYDNKTHTYIYDMKKRPKMIRGIHITGDFSSNIHLIIATYSDGIMKEMFNLITPICNTKWIEAPIHCKQESDLICVYYLDRKVFNKMWLIL